MISRTNPVTRVLAAVIISVPLITTLDVISAVVVVAGGIALLPLAGMGVGMIARRVAPLLVVAPLVAVSMLFYGVPHGQEYWQFGAIHMTDGSIGLALAVAVRVIALGLPAIVLFSTIDPTALADGLAQRLHAPARFVIAALAAVRLTTLVVNDWQNMALSRRARGLSDVAPVRRFVSMAFGLLVLSIRRGSKLATAMEARGFGTNTARTWARPSPVGWWDAALIGVALAIAVSAIVVSILTGSFRVVWL
ncbi:MAG: ABC transporter [Candidatus Lumbricidophila eiseniae]|uniref:ABC transporter n=1 Tax=Candidatus Lumbricidiphila eiseniae TaxID=1969409 RepID=A0A2A6FR01_9MICO|nr:MAG: ABC transporter [Candidatus Lumbricidophila eiseniae]